MGPLVFVLLFGLFAALVGWLVIADRTAPKAPAARLAVVVYGESAERWKALEAGIGQACAQWGLEKPVLALAGEGGQEEQIRLLRREIDGGAEGVLVAAADSAALQGWLENAGLSVPVVLVETGAGGAGPLVGADDQAMGRALAERYAGSGKTLGVLAGESPRESVQNRRAGFLQRAEELNLQVKTLEGRGEGEPLRQSIAAALAAQKPDALVMFDNESLEAAIDAAPAAMVEVELCGVGSSQKAIHAADTGLVSQLCYANEYAMGYQAVGQLAALLGLPGAPEGKPEPVTFVMADQETMFTPPQEQLLFQGIL